MLKNQEFLMKNQEGIKLNNLPELKTFRWELRNQLTPAEAKLWDYLKASKLDGRKFRRQHSVGPFILDFYCPGKHLAVKLDGQVHLSISTRNYDRERDVLAHFDILVLRFENKFVFEYSEYVMGHIKEYFGGRGEQPPRPAATPPCKGGVL